MPSTQTRLTGAGDAQQVNLTTRFANLRAQVSSQLDAVRRSVMQTKTIDCLVKACFVWQVPEKTGQEKIKCFFYDGVFVGQFVGHVKIADSEGRGGQTGETGGRQRS